MSWQKHKNISDPHKNLKANKTPPTGAASEYSW